MRVAPCILTVLLAACCAHSVAATAICFVVEGNQPAWGPELLTVLNDMSVENAGPIAVTSVATQVLSTTTSLSALKTALMNGWMFNPSTAPFSPVFEIIAESQCAGWFAQLSEMDMLIVHLVSDGSAQFVIPSIPVFKRLVISTTDLGALTFADVVAPPVGAVPGSGPQLLAAVQQCIPSDDTAPCGPQPLHVVVVVDVSGSIDSGEATQIESVVHGLANSSVMSAATFSFVRFETTATAGAARVSPAVAATFAVGSLGGNTCLGCGLDVALAEMMNDDLSVPTLVVVITDGVANIPTSGTGAHVMTRAQAIAARPNWLNTVAVLLGSDGSAGDTFLTTFLTGDANLVKTSSEFVPITNVLPELEIIACDTPCSDADLDTICDDVDNCPFVPNTDQANVNNPNTFAGDACECATPSGGQGFHLGDARFWNVAAFTSFRGLNSDIGGRLVGGIVDLTNYGIATANQIFSDGGSADSLVTMAFTGMSGQLYQGNLVHGMGDVVPPSFNVLSGTTRDDYLTTHSDNVMAYAGGLSGLSTSLCAQGGVAVAPDQYGVLNIVLTDPDVNVFSISSADLSATNTFNVQDNGNAQATVIINIVASNGDGIPHTADDDADWAGGMSVSSGACHVLVNTCGINYLRIGGASQGISVQASVLAVNAAAVQFGNGNQDGQMFASVIDLHPTVPTVSGEFHHVPFCGCLPITAPTTPPTPPEMPPMPDDPTPNDPTPTPPGCPPISCESGSCVYPMPDPDCDDVTINCENRVVGMGCNERPINGEYGYYIRQDGTRVPLTQNLFYFTAENKLNVRHYNDPNGLRAELLAAQSISVYIHCDNWGKPEDGCHTFSLYDPQGMIAPCEPAQPQLPPLNSPPASCTFEAVETAWSTGIATQITVSTTSQMNGMNIAWTLANNPGAALSTPYNLEMYVPASAASHSGKAPTWAASLPANTDFTFGYQGTYPYGTLPVPTVTGVTINGVPCMNAAAWGARSVTMVGASASSSSNTVSVSVETLTAAVGAVVGCAVAVAVVVVARRPSGSARTRKASRTSAGSDSSQVSRGGFQQFQDDNRRRVNSRSSRNSASQHA